MKIRHRSLFFTTQLLELGIPVIVHTILGLPGEDIKRNLETMHYLNEHHIQGIKLQLLHVLKYTDLADDYLTGRFSVYSMEEYFEVLSSCICNLSPDIVIQSHSLQQKAKPKALAPETVQKIF